MFCDVLEFVWDGEVLDGFSSRIRFEISGNVIEFDLKGEEFFIDEDWDVFLVAECVESLDVTLPFSVIRECWD